MRQYSSDEHESYVRGFLGWMLFSGDEPLKPAKVLSGGEKVRCMLSRMMLSGANVLIFDQPTNHLDLESIIGAEQWDDGFPWSDLICLPRSPVVQTIANRIIEFTPGR